MPAGSKLAKYQSKRDFQKTAEPRGDAGVRPSKALRFVVQRHDATRLHYDLRLELDGVFKSWAVTKGPSLNPADKRLAVEVEDHPLGYGDFEGTIPKGQYGGGTVQLFDRGTWSPEGKATAQQALDKGELKFVLHGERLKGGFVLVRLKKDRTGGKRTNWLLIKHRDENANDTTDGGGIPAIDTSVASGRTLETIEAGKGRAPTPFMLGKDRAPRADAIWNSSKGLAKSERVATDGVATRGSSPRTAAPSPKAKLHAPVRPAKPETLEPTPDFIRPQLCTSVAKPPSGDRWLHEIKFDGYRMQLRIDGGHAQIRTRTGLDWTAKFPEIAKAAGKLPDAILDGEVVVLDTDGRPDFPALQAALSTGKTSGIVFFAFDLLHCDGVDLRRTELTERKERLAALLAGSGIDKMRLRYVEHFAADGATVFASARDLGLEGIVSKAKTSIYRSGRSESWTKAKCRPSREVVIGGWTQTNGQFRSLLGGVFRDGALVFVGRIGTGYSAAKVATLMPKLEANAQAKSPFHPTAAPPRDKAIRWLDPVLVADVEFAGWSSDGLMFQAAYKGLRDEVAPADVNANPPGAPPKATALAPRTRPSRPSTKVIVAGVSLSNPDKALWPDAGDNEAITKKDLARYFEAVGPLMLPHIAGRPCSIVRAPDGIEGQHFFQRHAMAGGSKLFGSISISGDREAYLVVESVEALVAVAQSGGLELHPGNGAPGKPNVPARFVFDLDPAPDVAFAKVVAAARDLRDRLADLGLSGLCKTTGGKGLHVVVPLVASDKIDWDEAKAFAKAVCVAMERDAPKRFLTKASKAARKGKIFLDYLRNDRLATAVAPLSPRARPHAPVSMPLTWTQAKADLDPTRFTIRTVPKLLARSKAWSDYDEAAAPLGPAIRKLAKA